MYIISQTRQKNDVEEKYSIAPLNKFESFGSPFFVGKTANEIALHPPITTPLNPHPFVSALMILGGNDPA